MPQGSEVNLFLLEPDFGVADVDVVDGVEDAADDEHVGHLRQIFKQLSGFKLSAISNSSVFVQHVLCALPACNTVQICEPYQGILKGEVSLYH